MLASSLMIGLKSATLSPEELKFLKDHQPAGVILFKRNLKSFQQTYELCRELKSLSLKHPLLIGIDMEGGPVNRFSHLKESLPWPSAKMLSEKTPEEIFSVAKILGETLKCLGFDINFAPVVDLPLAESSLLKDRTFGKTKETIIEKASPFIQALIQEGVLPCLKHFPGHGAVKEDSHERLPKDLRTLKELADQLEIFETLFQNQFLAVMTAHIEFSQIEKGPSTFSSCLLTNELRKKRQFSGILISDDIDMLALKDFSPSERMFRALGAGCDLILSCQKSETYLQIIEDPKGQEQAAKLESVFQRAQSHLNPLRKMSMPLKSWPEVSKNIFAEDKKELFKKFGWI